jgi:hypothetical protein
MCALFLFHYDYEIKFNPSLPPSRSSTSRSPLIQYFSLAIIKPCWPAHFRELIPAISISSNLLGFIHRINSQPCDAKIRRRISSTPRR